MNDIIYELLRDAIDVIYLVQFHFTATSQHFTIFGVIFVGITFCGLLEYHDITCTRKVRTKFSKISTVTLNMAKQICSNTYQVIVFHQSVFFPIMIQIRNSVFSLHSTNIDVTLRRIGWNVMKLWQHFSKY